MLHAFLLFYSIILSSVFNLLSSIFYSIYSCNILRNSTYPCCQTLQLGTSLCQTFLFLIALLPDFPFPHILFDRLPIHMSLQTLAVNYRYSETCFLVTNRSSGKLSLLRDLSHLPIIPKVQCTIVFFRIKTLRNQLNIA